MADSKTEHTVTSSVLVAVRASGIANDSVEDIMIAARGRQLEC
jgi:hypothetical protein